MRFSVNVILAALVFAESSTAFTPSSRPLQSPSFVSRRQATKAPEGPEQPRAIFPGVQLPAGEIPEADVIPSVAQEVQAFLKPAAGFLNYLVGTPKDAFPFFVVPQELLKFSQNLGSQIPNQYEYKFFGGGDHAKNLVYLLKTNAFMATGLTEQKDCKSAKVPLELVAYDPSDPDCQDDSATVYRKMMRALVEGGNGGHRVNVVFEPDMSGISEIKVYDDTTGELVETVKNSPATADEIAYWASSATFNLITYASSVHATIHYLHFLCTAALDYCSKDFEAMNQWAGMYASNISNKYTQVGQLLILPDPAFLQTVVPSPDTALLVQLSTYAVLTGVEGFGFKGSIMRPILQDLLNTWFANPSDYLGTMMNISEKRMKEAGVLDEFMKHHDLITPYADEVSHALRDVSRFHHDRAEKKMKDYLKRCNVPSKIHTLEQWIEIMAVTGIVHGGTLSYSRMMASSEILRWRNIQSKNWEATDLKLQATLLATICGMDEDRHVFTSSTGAPYAPELQKVLDKYSEKSNELKEAYKNKIMENAEEFNEFGFILSDFCPDGFDGKQLTISTYI